MPGTIRMIIEDQQPLTAPAQTSVIEAARLMKQNQVGAIMVVEGARLVGIFTERDALYLVTADGRDARTTRLSEVMTRDPRTIHPDKPLADALQLMHENGFRNVPVVENGRPIGMVSARDACPPELEQFMYELVRQKKISGINV